MKSEKIAGIQNIHLYTDTDTKTHKAWAATWNFSTEPFFDVLAPSKEHLCFFYNRKAILLKQSFFQPWSL